MFYLTEKKIMRSHKKIQQILEKSETLKKYDAIGIITIIMIVSLIFEGIKIIQYCKSSKVTALIIKRGGPLVRMFIRKNIYNKIIKANVPENDAKIISNTIVEMLQSLSVEEIASILELAFNENS
jgi:hypothetical protein